MTHSEAYDAQVRAWAAALRARDTRTWRAFRDDRVPPVEAVSGPLPGSAQLEIVRRLAARGVEDAGFAALADLVLGTTSPGRGLVDPPLPWPESPIEFGTPAIEPDEQPADELVRAACAVLVRLLTDQPRPARRRRGVRWRRGFVLAGAPVTVSAVRDSLLAAGLREGGRRPTYLVLGGPLERLMAELWEERIRNGSAMQWRRLWQVARVRGEVAPAIDLPALAARFAGQAGPRRVHVILDENPDVVVRRAAEVVGVRTVAEPPRADVVATDLLRRLNPLLVLAAGENGRRSAVAGPWAAALAAQSRSAVLLGAPAGLTDWAGDAARRMSEKLAAGDYAVHGDPAVITRTLASTQSRDLRAVPAEEVLDLALDLVATLWRTTSRPAEGVS